MRATGGHTKRDKDKWKVWDERQEAEIEDQTERIFFYEILKRIFLQIEISYFLNYE